MSPARGRPLRFLATLVVGWVGVRAAMLWPRFDPVPAMVRAVVPAAKAAPRPAMPQVHVVAADAVLRADVASPVAGPGRSLSHHTAIAARAFVLERREPALIEAPAEPSPAPLLPGVPAPLLHLRHKASRWSGSAWLVARGGAGIAPGSIGGQLGGSQAGVRIAYMIDPTNRVALAGRVTTPLGAGLREAAIGLEWQPTRLPVRIVAEQRIVLGVGVGGPALGVVGGFGPIGIGGGFRLEGYGQGGVIRRDRNEPYVDGAVRATRPLASLGHAKISVGAGIWGAAQRGASRLDVGPALTLDLPLAQQPVRLSLEYRARVAGDAAPRSGMALTLGTDF